MRLLGRTAPMTAVALLTALVACAHAQELVPNGGMEAGQAGQPPAGWVLNAYGELAASLTQDVAQHHSGAAALRLECSVFRGGAAQAYVPVPGVKQGETYTLRAWMRASSLTSPVQLLIRDVGPPYHNYLGTTALVTEQWKPVVVTGKADLAGGNVGIFINYQSAGTLWVDDLSLMVGEHPVAAATEAPPIVKGNLVQNSGFELGLAGWTMPEMVAVEPGGVSGKCAHWLNKSGYMLEGRPVTLKPGQRYTFSADLRSPDPGTRVSVSLCEVGGGQNPGQAFDPTAQWQRVSFLFVAQPQHDPRYFLSFARVQGGSFLVDNVQLEEGDLTDYAPARRLEAAFDLPRSQRFPAVGEAVKIGVLCVGGSATAPLTLVASDYLGREVQHVSIPSDLARREVSLTFREPGFVSLVLRDNAGMTLDETQLCIIRPFAAGQTGDPFFGAHGTEGHPGEYHAITTMAKAGARAWRLHDLPSYTQWFMVEPEKGKFVWYDTEIDAMRARGLDVFGVFCRTPKWAGRDPGGEPVDFMAYPPRDWDEFGNYVFQTVSHYKAKIHQWEVWNEPWGRGFWAGTPEEYAKLLEVACTQAKRADPTCVIVGGCFWPPLPEFTDRVLAAGGAKYMDAVSYHHYCEPDAVAMGQVPDWYNQIRAKITAAGRPDIPVWMTEGGCSCPSYYWWLDRRDQARAAAETVAKHLIETKGLGIARYFYYHTWQEIGSPRMFHWLFANHWVLLEYDGSPKTIYAAYSGAAHELANAKPAGTLARGKVRAYAFARGQDTVLALWAKDSLTQPTVLAVDLGAGVTVRDMMGVDMAAKREAGKCVLALQSAPVYVTVKGMAADEALKRVAAG